ncbi:MAG: glycosyltransferase family 4 protein [Candidatus Krumholzibacteriia bacterium]
MPTDSTAPVRPLRVGIFVALLPPETYGGTEIQAERMASELAARGHEVHVFTRRQSAWRDVREDRVRVHRRAVLPVPGLRFLVEIVAGALQAVRHRPEVLLCYITLNSGLLGYVAHLVCGVPFVIWVRGVDEVTLRPGSWRTRLTLFLFERASGVWLQAEALRRTLREECEQTGRSAVWQRLEPRLRLLGNGLDLPGASAGSDPSPERFLFVGRLVLEKDLPTLIAAVRKLRAAELWIAGDGPLEAAMRREARGARVRFLGAQARQRIPELLIDSRALVLCSSREGMPNVVLEALAHGRPVVATSVGALPELVEDRVNGRLVPVGDADALCEALREMQDDATWRRLAAAARPSVERFGWPHLVRSVQRELRAHVEPALASGRGDAQ